MNERKRTLVAFVVSSTLAGGTMYLIGWRSLAGIIGAAIGTGLTIVLVTRTK
jgi:uncharacterized membrane protein YccC